MQVWKFPLEITDRARVTMPQGAEIVLIAEQDTLVWIWALVDPIAPYEDRIFRVAGTGHDIGPLEDGAEHLGSFLMQGGVFHVFHVFGRRS